MQAMRRLAGLALVAAAAVALPITLAQPASAACAPGTYPPSNCAPTVVLTAPTAPFTLSVAHPTWSLKYSGASIQSYQLRYNRARWNGTYEGWVYPSSWQNLHVASLTQTLPLGYLYCYSVRAIDTANRVSAWTTSRCTARPLDDRSLYTSAGWAKGTSTAFYMSTFMTTRTLNARAYRPGANVRRVAVVASTCPNCGTLGVYVGNTRVATLSLYSAAVRYQRILLVAPFSFRTNATITFKNLVSGRRAYIDGIGISRV